MIVLPWWAKSGCRVVREWQEPIRSGSSEGIARYVQYLDAKGKEQEAMMWVKWYGQQLPAKCST